MKYFIIAIVLVFAALMVQAQTNIPKLYTYKQKKRNDNLQLFFPELQASDAIQVQNNMPVLSLNNNGIKIGSNNLGELYSINLDKMPCLKPYLIKDDAPDAVTIKPLLPAQPKAKE